MGAVKSGLPKENTSALNPCNLSCQSRQSATLTRRDSLPRSVRVGKSASLPRNRQSSGRGTRPDVVFYIEAGKVRLPFVSPTGKEATLAILSKREFFGEGPLAGQALRTGSTTTMKDCKLMRIDKNAMMLALHREHTLSELFVAHRVARNIRYQEDLVDQLFNSSEKRLVRILLLLAHSGKEDTPPRL